MGVDFDGFYNRFSQGGWERHDHVVVDRFSKYAVFMTTQKPCKTKTIVELFFKHVVKYFGLPKDVVSN